MSGWDKPSRPTWDPQDGPEDGTQAFSVPDGSGADDPWSQPAGSGWGGPGAVGGQDFGRRDFDAPDFGGVNPPGVDRGGSDLGPADFDRADRREPGFADPSPETASRRDRTRLLAAAAPARDCPPSNCCPPDRNGARPERLLARPRRGPAATPPERARRWREPRPPASRGGYGSGPQASARDEPPWPGPARQESARQESARPDYGRAGVRTAGRRGRRAADYGRLDFGRLDFDRPGAPGQDFPRRDPRPDGLLRATPRTPVSRIRPSRRPPPRTGPTPSAPPGWTRPCRTSSPRPSQTRAMPAGGQVRRRPGPPARPGQPVAPGPGQPGPVSPVRCRRTRAGPPRRGDGRGPRRPGRPAVAWDDPAGYPTTGGPRLRRARLAGGRRRRRRLAVGQPRQADHRRRRRGRDRGRASAATWSLHSRAVTSTTPPAAARRPPPPPPSASTAGGEPTTASRSQPRRAPGVTGSATPPAATCCPPRPRRPATRSGRTRTSWRPPPRPWRPSSSRRSSGGGGTVTGSPVSASYTLPDEQTIEFVGYQGTFNPTTVMTQPGSFGSSEATYPRRPERRRARLRQHDRDGDHPERRGLRLGHHVDPRLHRVLHPGGGPEALTVAQSKGAEDTVASAPASKRASPDHQVGTGPRDIRRLPWCDRPRARRAPIAVRASRGGGPSLRALGEGGLLHARGPGEPRRAELQPSCSRRRT